MLALTVWWCLFCCRKTLNIPRMYLHRYLRYTPALAVMILVYTSLMKFLGSGPFFTPNIESCEKFWWSALLHVSVYTNPLELVSRQMWIHELIPKLPFSVTMFPGTLLWISNSSSSVRCWFIRCGDGAKSFFGFCPSSCCSFKAASLPRRIKTRSWSTSARCKTLFA